MRDDESRKHAEVEEHLDRIIWLYQDIQSMDLVANSAIMTKNMTLCGMFVKEFKEFIASPYAADVMRIENDRSITGHVYVKGFGYLPSEDRGDVHAIFDAVRNKVELKANFYRDSIKRVGKHWPGDEWIFPEEYVILDSETTGFDCKRDRIIEIAAVKYLDGAEVDQFVTLVNPGRAIPPEITGLTGISDVDLSGAPSFFEVLPGLMEFLGDLLIIAHNAPFDMSFLAEAYLDMGQVLENESIDTLKLARKAFPRLKSYKLEYLKELFGLTPGQSHRALADVYTTAELLALCKECPPEQLSRAREIDATRKSAGNKHTDHSRFSKMPKPSEISPSSPGNIDPAGPLYGKRIVFTGTLSMERRDAMQMAVDAGAKVVSAVSGKTDFLVVGAQDIALVGDDGLSSKEEKAIALNEAGKANIRVIDEAEFLFWVNGKECSANV